MILNSLFLLVSIAERFSSEIFREFFSEMQRPFKKNVILITNI